MQRIKYLSVRDLHGMTSTVWIGLGLGQSSEHQRGVVRGHEGQLSGFAPDFSGFLGDPMVDSTKRGARRHADTVPGKGQWPIRDRPGRVESLMRRAVNSPIQAQPGRSISSRERAHGSC